MQRQGPDEPMNPSGGSGGFFKQHFLAAAGLSVAFGGAGVGDGVTEAWEMAARRQPSRYPRRDRPVKQEER